MSATIKYTAACPFCGEDTEWTSVLVPSDKNLVATKPDYEIACRCE